MRESLSQILDTLNLEYMYIECILNKIRDLFKVKLYAIRSETKKRERERERDFKYLLTLILTGGHK